MSRTLLLLPLALLLQSCVTTGAATDSPVIVDNGCKWTQPIYISKADKLTDQTADQILAHNMTGQRLCGWQPTGKK